MDSTHKTGIVMLAAAAIAMIVAGCIPAPGVDNTAYILVPYALGFVALWTNASKLLKLRPGRTPGPRERDDAPTTARKLGYRLVFGAIATGASAVGELAYVLLNGMSGGFGYVSPSSAATSSDAGFAVLFVLLMAASAACFLLLWRRTDAGSGAQ